MKKITEKQLLESVRSLRDYTTSIAEADLSAADIGRYAGNAWQGVKDAAGAVSDTASSAWQSAKNTVGNIGDVASAVANPIGYAASSLGKNVAKSAMDTASNFAQGFNAAQSQPSAAVPTAAHKATPSATKAQPDPKVKQLQDKLIAAGAKIKADGVMGPATQQAMKDFPQAAGSSAATADSTETNPAIEKQYMDSLTAAANKYRTDAKAAGMTPEQIEKKVRELFPQLPVQAATPSPTPAVPGISQAATAAAPLSQADMNFQSTQSPVKMEETLARIIELARR